MGLTSEKILETVSKAKSLPSFPQVVFDLEKELGRSVPSVNRIAKLVSNDPALSARFLQLANSAFYTRSKKTTSITQAVMRLGLKETKRLVMATAVVGNFKDLGGGDPSRFWSHCLAVGYTTQVISEMATCKPDGPLPESVFSAGLLHDIGILVLFLLFNREYRALNERVLKEGGTTSDMEMESWKTEHGEVGELLARRWQLPDAICQVIRYHHCPWSAEPEHRWLVYVVHLSDFVCHNQGFYRQESGFPNDFDAGAWDALGLDLEQVPEIIEKVREKGKQSETFIEAFH